MALSILEAVILGIVQGLTEWLPVSSSGHLVLAQVFLGVHPPVFFDLFLHVATLLVIVLYFRKTILEVAVAVLTTPAAMRREGAGAFWSDPQRRLAWFVVLASVPTAIAGLFLEERLDALFTSAAAVAIALLATGTLLWVTKYARPGRVPLDWRSALLVGAAQGVAILPGVSRSGSTIGVATLLGVEREAAVRFSFLLYIPAVTGALILKTSREALGELAANAGAYAAGFTAAAAVGYATLVFLVFLIRQQRFHWFAPYCWALGGGVLVWTLVA